MICHKQLLACLCLGLFLIQIGEAAPVQTGAERTQAYFPKLKGTHFAVVANPTSRIGETHLVDSLLVAGLRPQWIYAPEHGFRGRKGAGEKVADNRDAQTGLRIRSLYGSHKKPDPQHLRQLDWVVFDIQDVGARFYTYLSTLHYVMEACAEAGVPLLLLDRPNPNGHFVDGPVLDTTRFRSFVGMHPIPVVHGMTLGELARMINGEGWLAGGKSCTLEIVNCTGWAHADRYQPPVAPSPNLPNWASMALYPSLCFFEGTAVSVGRGTDHPFQCYGHPELTTGSFTFTPEADPLAAPHPKLLGEPCTGAFLKPAARALWHMERLHLAYLTGAYHNLQNQGVIFFTRPEFFDLLAGTDRLRKAIESGKTSAQIGRLWQEDVRAFVKQRKPYLLYPLH